MKKTNKKVSGDIFKCTLCKGYKIRQRGGKVGMVCINNDCKNYLKK